MNWQVRDTAVKGHTQSWIDIQLGDHELWLRVEYQGLGKWCFSVGLKKPDGCQHVVGRGALLSQAVARQAAEEVAEMIEDAFNAGMTYEAEQAKTRIR